MITITINLQEITQQIEDTIAAFQKLDESLTSELFVQQVWPQIRTKTIEYLRDNLDKINDIPNSGKWRDAKKELMGTPLQDYPSKMRELGFRYTTIRYKGGDWEPVVSPDSFIATGVMDDIISSQLVASNFKVNASPKGIFAEIEADVSMLIDEYPLIVDEQIMGASGGYLGLVRLTVTQQNELLESLINQTMTLAEQIFTKK